MVLEIEGDLKHLRWTGHVLQRPRFDPEVREQRGEHSRESGPGNIPRNRDQEHSLEQGPGNIPWNGTGSFPENWEF